MTKALQVSAKIPASPVIVIEGELIAKIAELKAAANAIQITDAKTEAEAARILRDSTELARDIEKCRVAVKKPFLDISRKIDDAAKAPTADVLAAKKAVQARLAEWERKQAAIRAEEERKRREAIARLEAERKQKEEEAKRLAEAEAEAAAAELPDLSEDALPDLENFAPEVTQEHAQKEIREIDNKIAELSKPQPPAVTRPQGIQYRTTLVIKSTDVNKLPDGYLIKQADTAAIRRDYCVGWKEGDAIPQLPGVVFEVSKTPVSSGRR